jgi:hypothetical protein
MREVVRGVVGAWERAGDPRRGCSIRAAPARVTRTRGVALPGLSQLAIFAILGLFALAPLALPLVHAFRGLLLVPPAALLFLALPTESADGSVQNADSFTALAPTISQLPSCLYR